MFPNGIPWGQLIFGLLPLRRPVVTVGKVWNWYLIFLKIFVVGKPIDVIQIDNPTSNDIDQLHKKYLLAVEQLFSENKDKYGLKHVKLEII